MGNVFQIIRLNLNNFFDFQFSLSFEKKSYYFSGASILCMLYDKFESM